MVVASSVAAGRNSEDFLDDSRSGFSKDGERSSLNISAENNRLSSIWQTILGDRENCYVSVVELGVAGLCATFAGGDCRRHGGACAQ